MPPAPDPAPVVLQVLPALETGGVERGTVEITEALVAAGWGAVVASAGGRLAAAIARAGGRHVSLPLQSRNPLTMWRNIARLAALIAAERVALVHARSRAPAWSAWAASRRAGVPFVTTYHGVYNEDLPGKRLYNSVMARGAVVIAASHYVAAHVVARHGVDPARIRVIPRGVDPSRFAPEAVSGARVARLAAEWRLPDGVPVAMLPGRLTGWKGQAVLVEALAALPGVMGVLVGSDQGRHRYRKALLRRAARLGVSERLRLVGECADMPAALADHRRILDLCNVPAEVRAGVMGGTAAEWLGLA
ncbi:MAG: glycosyltransferase [Acetobacteraceae bacterium]